MKAYKFYLKSRKQRKAFWVKDDSHVSGQKNLWWKESVRRCSGMMQQPVLLSLKSGTKSLHIFTHSQ
jgi:hypothetical protein